MKVQDIKARIDNISRNNHARILFKQSLDIIFSNCDDNTTKDDIQNIAAMLRECLSKNDFFKKNKADEAQCYRQLLGRRTKDDFKKAITENLKHGDLLWELLTKDIKEKRKEEAIAYKAKTTKKSEKPIKNDYNKYLEVSFNLLNSGDIFENYVGLLAVTARRPAELFKPNIFGKAKKRTYKIDFHNLLKSGDNKDCTCYSLILSTDLINIHSKVIGNLTDRINHLEERAKNENLDYENLFNGSNEYKRLNEIFRKYYDFLVFPEGERPTVYFLRKMAAACLVVKNFSNLRNAAVLRKAYDDVLGHKATDASQSYDYLNLPSASLINKNKFKYNPIKLEKTTPLEPNQKKIEPEIKKLSEIKSKTKEAAEERLMIAITTLKEHNESMPELKDKIAITTAALIHLTGAQSITVKRFFEENSATKDDVDCHNQKYNFGMRQNYGKKYLELLKLSGKDLIFK